MIWGYPYFWKHPDRVLLVIVSSVYSVIIDLGHCQMMISQKHFNFLHWNAPKYSKATWLETSRQSVFTIEQLWLTTFFSSLLCAMKNSMPWNQNNTHPLVSKMHKVSIRDSEILFPIYLSWHGISWLWSLPTKACNRERRGRESPKRVSPYQKYQNTVGWKGACRFIFGIGELHLWYDIIYYSKLI